MASLRNNSGSLAYFPTSCFHRIFDEGLQTQEDTGVSADILEQHNFGVTNVEPQNVCTVAEPAGTFYPHEGVPYNPHTFLLAKDALTSNGPGNLSRMDVVANRQNIVANGLGLLDLLPTERAIVIAGYETIAYPNQNVISNLLGMLIKIPQLEIQR
jgi:hypothetical protein